MLLALAACGQPAASPPPEVDTSDVVIETPDVDIEDIEDIEDTNDVEPPAAANGDQITLGIVMIDLTSQFFVDMMTGGDDAAEDFGVEVIWTSADGDLDTQISLMENFVAQEVDVILVNPIDNDGLASTIIMANEAGIPTVNMAGLVDSPLNWNTFYNDFEDTKVLGQILAHLVGEEGEVGLIYGNRGNLVSDMRRDGFHAAMDLFPDVEFVEQPGNWDAATAFTVMENMLAANPNLRGFHCVYDEGTLAALQAVNAAGRADDMVITSFNGDIAASEAVRDGDIKVTLLTGAKRVGYWNVKIGSELARGYRPSDHILQMPTHFVMNDDLRTQVEGWGLADGISIITPDEAITLFNQYRLDLGPDAE